MIDVKQIKKVEGLYKNKNLYFIVVFIERGAMEFKIAYPYILKSKAQQAIDAIKRQQQENIPIPDYKPSMWIVEDVNKR